MTRRSGRRGICPDGALENLGKGRAGAIQILSSAKIGSPEYTFAGYVCDAIDDLAERLTGDRSHFHSKPATTAPRDDQKNTK